MSIVDDSRILALTLHRDHRRRSGANFFNHHIEPVAHLVTINGGDDLAIASAFLHDAPEDIGKWTRTMIGTLSPDVLAIVDALTEDGESWDARKLSYLRKIASMPWQALLISLSDKIITGYDFLDEWKRQDYGARPRKITWFYKELEIRYTNRATTLGKASSYSELLKIISNIVRSLEVLCPIDNLGG